MKGRKDRQTGRVGSMSKDRFDRKLVKPKGMRRNSAKEVPSHTRISDWLNDTGKPASSRVH